MPSQVIETAESPRLPSSGLVLILVLVALCVGGAQWRRQATLRPESISQSQRMPSSSLERLSATYTVDVNQANELELLNLPEVGPALVRAIVSYRERHGPFERLEDFEEIPGIGAATLRQLAPYLRFPQPAKPLSDEAILTAQSRERTVP